MSGVHKFIFFKVHSAAAERLCRSLKHPPAYSLFFQLSCAQAKKMIHTRLRDTELRKEKGQPKINASNFKNIQN
jgi:hypothetical protein